MREVMNLQKSTQENSRLRKLVRYYQLQIKSVERAFKRRKRASEVLISCSTNQLCSGLDPHFHNQAVFDELVAGMDEVYANLDDFYTRVKMHELPCPGRRNDSIKFRERNTYVELLDCYAVPFDLRKTEKAVWTLRTTRAGESNAIFSEYFGVDENTSMKSVCIVASGDGIEMRLIVHGAIRKYVEQERTIFISRLLVEPIHEVFPVAFKEVIRLVLKHGKSSVIGPTTIIQTHCRVTAHDKMDQGKYHNRHESWKTNHYYAIGAMAWEYSLTDFNHKLEDMLLRESLHCSSAGMVSRK